MKIYYEKIYTIKYSISEKGSMFIAYWTNFIIKYEYLVACTSDNNTHKLMKTTGYNMGDGF